MEIKKPGCLILVSIAILVATINPANASTLYVPDDYPTIQQAIDNANVGDKIIVKAGTYNENVVIDKKVTLSGQGNPTIDAGNSGSVVLISADGVTFEGFTVKNSGYNWGDAGVRMTSSNNVVKNNDISNCNCGIYLHYSSRGNSITGNDILENYVAIYLFASSDNEIKNNNLNDNECEGIYFSSASKATVEGNHINNNGYHGIISDQSSTVTVKDNVIDGNGQDGVFLYGSNSFTLTGNTISNNDRYGIYISFSSYNEVYNNVFENADNYYVYNSVNEWNTDKTLGKNILDGTYIGGNAWLSPDGTGYSETCTDDNDDGICDSPYTLSTNNIDNLPLAASGCCGDPDPPSEPTPCELYDTNGIPGIQLPETTKAITDYFSEQIDLETVIAVLTCYFNDS